jgi:hypothetical protein
MNFVVRIPPLGFSFHRLAPLEFCHIAGHRLTAHDVVGPELYRRPLVRPWRTCR